MRYFFHTFDGADSYDDTGTECSSMRDVCLHMLTLARAAIEDSEVLKSTQQIEAQDGSGKIVGLLDMSTCLAKPSSYGGL